MVFPGYIGPSYQSQSLSAAIDRTVNYYGEIIETEPAIKSKVVLYPSPGFEEFAELPDRPIRGLAVALGRLFAVAGGCLYEVSANGAAVKRGDCPIKRNRPVEMTHNGDGGKLLFIADNHLGHYFDLETDTFYPAVVADVDRVGQIDGFFVGLDDRESILRVSPAFGRAPERADPAAFAWDATEFERRSAASDPWRSMVIWRDQIVLMGRETSEIWRSTGGLDFPFSHDPNVFIERGILAPDSLARVGGTIMWLGSGREGSGQVFLLNGVTPERVSTHAVEWAIARYREESTAEDAIGWSFELKGHTFYVLEFRAANHTWVFDAATGFWQEWGAWSADVEDYIAWRPRFHAEAYGRSVVSDSRGGKIAKLSLTNYRDLDGGPVRRERTAPHLSVENTRMFYPYFELEAQRGVGTLVGAEGDVNPTMQLEYSNDHGRTWSIPRQKPLGAIGEFSRRIRWDNCGSGRGRVFRTWTTAAVPVVLINAYLGVRSKRSMGRAA